MNTNYVDVIPPTLCVPKTLYKYRSVDDRALKMLADNKVYFSSPCNFNDPYESAKIFGATLFGARLDAQLKQAGMLCLCSEPDNLAMWSLYADALKGFAVGYEMTGFLASVAPGEWKYVYEVSYEALNVPVIDEAQIVQSSDDMRKPQQRMMFATKPSIFSHENEIRIVRLPESNFQHLGFGEYAYASECVTEIIFGELISIEDEKKVRDIFCGKSVSYRRARRSTHQFRIEIVDA